MTCEKVWMRSRVTIEHKTESGESKKQWEEKASLWVVMDLEGLCACLQRAFSILIRLNSLLNEKINTFSFKSHTTDLEYL